MYIDPDFLHEEEKLMVRSLRLVLVACFALAYAAQRAAAADLPDQDARGHA